MEIIQVPLDENTIKLQIGSKYNVITKKLEGSIELDIENQANFIEILMSLYENKSPNVIVDMENITYIDSSGLWALFEGHKKATQMGKKLILINVSKDVYRVLGITKMSSKLSIFSTDQEAINFLESLK